MLLHLLLQFFTRVPVNMLLHLLQFLRVPVVLLHDLLQLIRVPANTLLHLLQFLRVPVNIQQQPTSPAVPCSGPARIRSELTLLGFGRAVSESDTPFLVVR